MWKFKSKAKRMLQPYCADCGTTRGLQTHHETYERFGNEDFDDLLVLCKKCHAKRHGRYDKAF